MAANNFFAYGQPPTAAYQSTPATPAAATPTPTATAYPPVPPPPPVAVQPPPPPGVAYNQAASVTPSTAYRAAPQATVVAYSAYQPPQNSAATYVAPTPAASVAVAAAPPVPAPVVTATYPAASTYTQYSAQPATAQVYDPNKSAATYYATPPNGVAVSVNYTVGTADPHYQARPVYSTNSTVNMIARPAAIINAPPRPSYTTYSQSSATPSYTYQATVTAPKHAYIHNHSVPSNVTQVPPTPPMIKSGGASQSWSRGQPQTGGHQGRRAFQPRVPPKQQQLHYCEVCKVSCAGPQTYQEHLGGQKHKKKEAAMKSGAPAPTTKSGNALRCELCDVTCTGSDAYAAHIRGAKHQKVVKLHTKLGKPIPSVDPVLISKGDGESNESASQSTNVKAQLPASKSLAMPKITFVSPGDNVNKSDNKPLIGPSVPSASNVNEVTIPRLPDEKEIQPVGHEYIEEVKGEDGKSVSFNCKLCECRFNDPNAKEMHMKGRRHRLQYKKKVDPELEVDIKPSLRQKKLAEERAKRFQAKEDFWKRREEEFKMMEEEERSFWEDRRKFEEENQPRTNMSLGPPHPRFIFGYHKMMMRKPETVEDRHVMAKHSEIYPQEDELEAIQTIVLYVEKALKEVSDELLSDGQGENKEDQRILKGVMRVGVLAKGLVLRGDKRFRLVVLCSQKPTVLLVKKIVSLLPIQLQKICPQQAKFSIKDVVDKAGFVVIYTADGDKTITLDISVTSPLMRAENESETDSDNDKDVLDSDKCLEALAALRHAKWFQARAQGRHSCVMIIRILREFLQRVPVWQALEQFSIELIVEKVLASAGVPLTPGDALRRVFESIAGGILLPDAPGILDPCERKPQDVCRNLTPQQREDITASAQHALRLIAFRQTFKVLGMEPLPPPKFVKTRFGPGVRKRKRDDSADEKEGEQVEKREKKELAE